MLRKFGVLAAFVFVFALIGGTYSSDLHASAAPAFTAQATDSAGGDDGSNGKGGEKKGMEKRPYAKKLQKKLRRPGPPRERPKYKPWGEIITPKHVRHDGLIPIYTKDEKVYFEIDKALLDKPMLAILSLSQGIGSHFVFGGLPIDNVMFDFHRSEDHIQMRRLSSMFRAPGDAALQKTIALTFANSIVETLPILTEKNDKMIVDVSKVFLSDISGMDMWLTNAIDQPVRLDSKKGYFESINNYPQNTEIDTRLTYSPGRPDRVDLPSVPDPRYIQIGVHYSIRKLPENPMMPRIADDRVGYFTTSFKDFTREGDETFFVHYAHRWRLEKKDPNAALSEPVKPILFYVDRTVPEKYTQCVIDGVQRWQKAFEAAGFKNAIICKRAPTPEEDPEYDPEDARYNTLRWNVSDSPLYGAIGPSRVDPRTGEIIDADILFEHNMVANFGKSWRRLSKPETALMMVDPTLRLLWKDAGNDDSELKALSILDKIPQWRNQAQSLCNVSDCVLLGGEFLGLALADEGEMTGGKMPEEYVKKALTWVVSHEVGHTLGLRHNFKSSASTPYSELNDKDVIAKIGMTGSVMDYPSPNVAADHTKQGYYYSPTVGTYDLWAIEWGYKPVEGKDPWAQKKELDPLAAKCTDKDHYYGTDEDAYPLAALDPRTNTNDLSDDPMRWAQERIGICNRLLENGKFTDRILAEGESFWPLRDAVQTLMIQKYIACRVAVKNVGGSYTSRAHKGSGVAPLQPVPAAEQRKALDFIVKNAFDTKQFLLSPALLNRLEDDKMYSWQNNLFSPTRRFDFPLSIWVASMQNGILTNLMNPVLQDRVIETAYKVDNPFTLSDLYAGLTRAIWTDKPTPTGREAGLDRNLQRIYLDKLIAQVTEPSGMLLPDAIALSRLQLRRIRGTAESALQSKGLDDATNAHLMETVARIDRALDAKRVTNF